MGCVSSKMIAKSASFRDEWNRLSFGRKGDGLDELILSKNGRRGEQLVALLCTPNYSIARSRLREEEEEGSPTPALKPAGKNEEEEYSSSLEHTSSEETCSTDKNQNCDQGSSAVDVSMTSSDHSIGPSRRFRTIEDFDAMLAVAAKQSSGGPQSSVDDRAGGGGDERPGSRRRAMAKELAALSVPSGSSSFEFSRAGSRLLLGGGGGGGLQVVASSPGSYVTPKFGNFVDATQRDEADVAVFHPELIAHFEQAMEQLTMEEACILEKIIEGLDQEFSEEVEEELLMIE